MNAMEIVIGVILVIVISMLFYFLKEYLLRKNRIKTNNKIKKIIQDAFKEE